MNEAFVKNLVFPIDMRVSGTFVYLCLSKGGVRDNVSTTDYGFNDNLFLSWVVIRFVLKVSLGVNEFSVLKE